jgi:hypothetical protein
LQQLLENNNLTVKKSNTWTVDQSIFGFVQSCLNSMPWFPPNDFYRALKHTRSQRINFKLLVQILLVLPLIPLAFIEFLVSGGVSKGSCINLQVVPKPDLVH